MGLLVEDDDNRPLFVAIDGMIDTATDDDNSANSDSGEHYTVNPILRAAIPDVNELIQILHHAATWSVDTCFFVVGGYSLQPSVGHLRSSISSRIAAHLQQYFIRSL